MKYKFNLMAIIAGLIFFAIGLFLALMDAFVWDSPTAIVSNIGCSLLASAVVALITALLVDRRKENPLDEWKISKIYSTRAEKNADSDPELERARYQVDAVAFVQDAVNAMCETLETKKTFQTYASELARLFRYADRDDVDDAVRARKNAILAIYEGLQQKRKHADNTDLMVQINGIVNEYIHVEKPDQEAVPSRQFDISKIDFDLLSREFAHTRRKNLLLRDLDELVNQQLAKMLFANPQRIDYYDRYQEIIDAYNAEQNRATIEKTFMDLMELASSLDTEQQRYVREGFSSDEELSVYDLLFSENLTKQEIETIKKVSVDLLTKIKQQIAKLDHWTDKQETKAIVDNLIRKTLWQELPNSYDVSDIQTYQKKIYEYVYMRYPEVA